MGIIAGGRCELRVMIHRAPRSPALQTDLQGLSRVPPMTSIFSFLFLFWCRGREGVQQVACGLLVSRPGIEPGATAMKAWSSNHWTTTESLLMSSPHPLQSSPLQGSISASRVQRLDFLHINKLPNKNPSCILIAQCGRRHRVSGCPGKGPTLPPSPWSSTTTWPLSLALPKPQTPPQETPGHRKKPASQIQNRKLSRMRSK